MEKDTAPGPRRQPLQFQRERRIHGHVGVSRRLKWHENVCVQEQIHSERVSPSGERVGLAAKWKQEYNRVLPSATLGAMDSP